MTKVYITQAKQDDVETVATLWTAISHELHARGSDQWQYPVRIDGIRQHVSAGSCRLINNQDGEPIGSVTVDEFADPLLWLSTDDPSSAYYVHRLILMQSVRGNETGSAILDWASRLAKHDGKSWLRLDAWTTNTHLHDYYLNHGFNHVRTVKGHSIKSGVLFQRDSGFTLGRGPVVQQC